MLKCDKRVYEQCPDKEYCGSLDNAVFVEGSECDKYNRGVLWDIERKTAANVVRCKDCKYSTKLDNEYGHNGVECALFCEDFGENDFCSYGELRYGNATEAEPVKHGQWKYIGVWMCSNCGEGYRLPSGCKPVADCKMHSCPNCEAKMDGA